MSIRTLWKGVIHVDRHEVPVRLYAAAKDHTVHFRLLHKTDHEPVRQRMIDGETGEEVPKERRRKGAEIEPGRLVLLDEEELEKLEPEPSRQIEVLRFIPREILTHEWYNRPYLLGPDGNDGAYNALTKAVEASGKEGIARWVMRKKRYVGSLGTIGGCLSLTTLRFADEVVEPAEIGEPSKADVDPRELEMARQLMSMLETPFDPARYHDEYRNRVVEMLKAKAKGGGKVKARKAKPEPAAESLGDALRASLGAAKKGGKRSA